MFICDSIKNLTLWSYRTSSRPYYEQTFIPSQREYGTENFYEVLRRESYEYVLYAVACSEGCRKI